MNETVVTRTRTERVLVGAGLPVLGIAVVVGLSLAADWIAGLPWAPLQGPIRLVARIPEPYATIGAVLVGAAAGVVLALVAAGEAVTVRLDDRQVTITRDERSQTVRRDEVTAVFVDGKDLVVLGPDTGELVREHGDPRAGALAEAFGRHGYPWHDADPYEYRRWVDDLPDLPAGADALFRARERAIGRKDRDDADDLRAELGRLGVVVRDDDKRQYWRLVTGRGCPTPDAPA